MEKYVKVSAVSVVVIVLAVIAMAALGGRYSVMNRDWYDALNKPSWQPPNWLFGPVWTVLFILFAISLILIWNTLPRTGITYAIMGLAVLNGILNIAWSWLFFGNKLIYPAIYDSLMLCLSVIAIMIVAWPISRAAGLLLAPYALWSAFATYLTATIYKLNP
jgi:benzodiazapine receptor